MQSRDPSRSVSRPIVSTLTAAQVELKRWLEESCVTDFQDLDGQLWRLNVRVQLIPDPATAHGLLWEIRVGLSAEVKGVELIATNALCPEKDARLLALIGENIVPFVMRPTVYTAADEARAREIVAEVVPKLKETLARQSLVAVKRDLVGRWVDQECQFGGHEDGF